MNFWGILLLITIALSGGILIGRMPSLVTYSAVSFLLIIGMTVNIVRRFLGKPKVSEAVLILENRRIKRWAILVPILCLLNVIVSASNLSSPNSNSWPFIILWLGIAIYSIFDMYVRPSFISDEGINIRNDFIPWHDIKSYSYFDWNEIEFEWAKPTIFREYTFRLRPYPHDLVSREQINAVLSKYLPRTESSELEVTQQPS